MRNISKRRLNFLFAAVFLLSSSAIFGAGAVSAQVPPLSSLPVPRPSNLADFIRDEEAARVLGKALFWDMQVGSDGVQACATCHFRAGADPRKKNQVSPGLLRVLFQPDPPPASRPRSRTPTSTSTARGQTTPSVAGTSPSGASRILRTANPRSST